MIEHWLRPTYQRVFVTRMATIASTYLTPSAITLLAGICGLLIIPSLAYNHAGLACAFMLASGYLDTLDGTVARLTKSDTPFGSTLDIVIDRVVEFSILSGLALVNPSERLPLCFLILGSILFCITSFLVVGIFTPNETEKSFHYSPGLIERPEAFGFFTLMILLPDFFNPIAILFCLLVCYTTIKRLLEFYQFASSTPS